MPNGAKKSKKKKKTRPGDDGMPPPPPRKPKRSKASVGREMIKARQIEKKEALKVAATLDGIVRMKTDKVLLTRMSIWKVCDLPCPGSDSDWTRMSRLDREGAMDSIHSSDHAYIVWNRDEARFYKIGPCNLPFFSGYYEFDIEVETIHKEDVSIADPMYSRFKRQSGSSLYVPHAEPAWGSSLGETLRRLEASKPRSVDRHSLRIHTDRVKDCWPPTAGRLAEVYGLTFPGSSNGFATSLFANKSLMKALTKMPISTPEQQRLRDDVVRAYSPMVVESTRVHSSDHLNRVLFGIPGIPKNPDQELLRERCAWAFREYFLGPTYFDMCRFFSPEALIAHEPSRVPHILPSILGKDEMELPRRLVNQLLRPDRMGLRFLDGWALVGFINEHVSNKLVVKECLPPFARPECFGTPRKENPMADENDKIGQLRKAGMTPDEITDLGFTSRPPDAVERDGTSVAAVSRWYDRLKEAYARLGASEYVATGDVFPSATVEMNDAEYAGFLVGLQMIEVFPPGTETVRCIEDLERRAPPDGILFSSVSAAGDAKKRKHMKKRPVSTAIPPSAIGSFSPSTIYLRQQASVTEYNAEVILDMLSAKHSAFVESSARNLVENAISDAGARRLASPRDPPMLTAPEMYFLDNVRECLSRFGEYGRWANLATRAYKAALLSVDPVSYTLPHAYNPSVNSHLPDEGMFARLFGALSKAAIEHLSSASASYGEPFSRRLEAWISTRRTSTATPEADLRSTAHTVSRLARYPIVVVDTPSSYADPDQGSAIVDAVGWISDYNITPDSLDMIQDMNRDSVAHTRPRSQDRMVCMHEVEKWTLQELKEAITSAFFDWRDDRVVQGRCSLWIFSDMAALDLGSTTLIERLLSNAPCSCQITLRKPSENPIVPRVHRAPDDPEDFYTRGRLDVVVSEIDDHAITITDGGTEFEYRLTEITLGNLSLYRRPASRPLFAKVQLSSLHDWRQLYTITCYVQRFLLLVGSPRSFERLRETIKKDIVDDPSGGSRFMPERCTDIWSSIRTQRPSSPVVLTGKNPDQGSSLHGTTTREEFDQLENQIKIVKNRMAETRNRDERDMLEQTLGELESDRENFQAGVADDDSSSCTSTWI